MFVKFLKSFIVLLAATLLSACGGGGGSSGSSSGGSSGSTNPVATLVVSLADSSGAALATPRTLKSGYFYLAQAKALDASGNPIANQVITFSTDSTLVTLATTTALTDATGIASVKMTPLSVAGAGSVGASMSYIASGATTATAITGVAASYQVTPSAASGTPTLSLNLTDATGAALATPRTFLTGSNYKALVTVLDGTSAPIANQLVTFTTDATLATISPASALTDSNGVASVQIAPLTTTGAGSVQASAVVSGSSYKSPSVSYQVSSTSVVAAMSFVSATPTSIVVSNASSGSKLSTVIFKLTNAQGVGVGSQAVNLSLNAQSISAGVTFLVNGVSSNTTQTLVTDQNGMVSINVASGTLPTPILVTATSVSNSNLTATSVGLAVTNGRPTQLRSSIASTVLSIEASGGGSSVIQGVQTTLTVLLSDRVGNPIPAGTVVNLVASHGQVSGSCTVAIVSNTSQCTAVWTSAASRPSNGWFTVLAYLDGEEDFIDTNGNNQYDAGEPFYDEGQAYLPKDGKASAYNAALDQPIQGGMTGTSACAVTNSTVIPYMIPNTCDNQWSSSIRVRLGIVLNWSTSFATITKVSSTATDIVLNLADDLGNSVPSGSSLSGALACPASVVTTPTVSLSRTKVPNTLGPITVQATFSDSATGCSFNFSLTTPAGSVTNQSYKI
ncbi:MAG: hypothetical protein EKK45_08265 [Curvibacter sp.]|nr:MAG: hypothetical protein EKK45_08265 [Curvibacter sp.]